MKLNRSFNIKAVEAEDESLYGIVRMRGKKGVFKVSGICAEFETDEQRENLQLNTEHLFFYGNIRDLDDNYYQELPFSKEELKGFRDKQYSEATLMSQKTKEGEIGYVRIPLQDMQLDLKRRGLVDILVSAAEEELPRLVNELIKVEIRADDSNYMKAFGNMFSVFPAELMKKALQNSSFYKLPTRKR